MNKIIITGNLGKDAMVSDKEYNGKKAINFSVGVQNPYSKKDEKESTTWFSVVLWRQTDKLKIADYLKKGAKVLCEGAVSLKEYKNKEGYLVPYLEIAANEVELIGSKADGEGASGGSSSNTEGGQRRKAADAKASSGTETAPGTSVTEDDDLPF